MTTATAVLPRVAIVGRPNVGKSSLFNRILGERRAIVEDEPGTTRDRVEADVEWRDRRFRLIDTGGFETDEENLYAPLIVAQIRTAIETADLVLFCIDARDGLTASDYDVAEVVRRSRKPTIVVANKCDNESREVAGIADAAALGFDDVLPVSALHDVNIGLMLDEVVARLPASPAIVEEDRVRIAVVGRPNVGKSMLVNAILGEERVIVSDVAGATRDAIDTEIDTPQGNFTLIDTAGVRRPGQRGKGLERHSVLRTQQAIERADVAVLLIDGTEGVTAQDMAIAGMVVDAYKGLVIAVNKIDLWEDPDRMRNWAERQMRSRIRFVPWALVTFISALERKNLDSVLELAATAREARRRRIPTADLNATLNRAFREHVPPTVHNKRFKLYYATQASIDPPTFVLFVNDPTIMHFSYRRYLERVLRQQYDFEGTAIKLVFRGRNEDNSRP